MAKPKRLQENGLQAVLTGNPGIAFSKWEQSGQDCGSGGVALTTKDEQSAQMYLGLFNYNKCPKVFACVSATLWYHSGGQAENPHCLCAAPWNVGVDFKRIKLGNQTEATERGKPQSKYTEILIILQWESIYKKVNLKGPNSLKALCIINPSFPEMQQ